MDAALQQLEGHVNAGNVDAGSVLLQQIKVARITENNVSDTQYVAALECGVFLAVHAQDLDTFSRHMQQLQPLYAVLTTTMPRKNHIIGLNLMALLVTASSSEFHSELELLHHDQLSDPCIQFPIAVERKFMVGIYDEILSMVLPHPSYQFFMEQLASTVRDAIADCIEVSYASLTLQQAAEIMKFDYVSQQQDFMEYIETAREDWIIENETITFQPSTTGTAISAQEIPSQQWIQQSLTYATEMERII
jgi:26S proteasome regulatory subunit N12